MKKIIFYTICILTSVIIYGMYYPYINANFISQRIFKISPGEEIQIDFPDVLDQGCTYEILINNKNISSLERDKIDLFLKKNLLIIDNKIQIPINIEKLIYTKLNIVASFKVPQCLSNKSINLKLLNKDNTCKNTIFFIRNYREGKYAIYESVYRGWLFLITIFPLFLIITTEVILRTIKKRKIAYYIFSFLLVGIDIILISFILMPFL